MKLGKFTIDVLDTGIFGLDGGAMFGVVPKALWARAYNPGDDLNRIPLSARPMLIQWDKKKVLIDTGNGNKFNEKFASIYNLDKSKTDIHVVLQQAGLKPEDITDVIFTHLHFDHAGGATIIENGKLVPTFPNARHFVQKTHFKWAENPTEKDRASFIKDNYLPLHADGLIEFTDGPGELFPGISVEQVNGHTPGMQIVRINDNEQTLLYAADLCPTSAHVPVPYVMGFDNNPLTVIEEKKTILPRAYEEGWIVAYEHDAFKQATVINANEKGFFAGDLVQITD